MGQVFAEVELLNAEDVALSRKNLLGEEEIRRFQKTMLVDTGSMYLCINENIQEVLQAPSLGMERIVLADDKPISCPLVGPIRIKFKNRSINCGSAVVLPGGAAPLLGLLPLEELDVWIYPNNPELQVNPNYPDYPYHRV